MTLFRRTAFLLLLIAFSGVCRAQDIVYTKGNVKIIQYADNWQMLHGSRILAHGNGTIATDNFAPLVQNIIDHYSTKPVSLKKSLAQADGDEEPEYLIKTQWDQSEPYNNYCPTIDGERVPAGCVTISSAQILNYYKHCNPLHPQGTHSIYAKVESPYMQLVNIEDPFYTYTFDFEYNPDFDKINSDDDELAKFIFAIALQQKAYFDAWGSMTSIYTQSGAFDNFFGYDYDIYEDQSQFCDVIIQSIGQKRPVIVSDPDLNHSYIFDGYNSTTKEFHVNFGWGGLEDGWYTAEVAGVVKFDALLVAYPSDGSRVKLKDEPKFCYIKNQYEKEYTKIPMKNSPASSGSDKNFMIQDLVRLSPGEYEFYLEYADGSTIAPAIPENQVIWQGNTDLIGKGNYQHEPCRFTVTDVCRCNITQSQEMGYICLQTWSFVEVDFSKFNPSLLIDGQELPMHYDAAKHEYWIEVDCKPGEHKFQVKNNLYNKMFAVGVYPNSAGYNVVNFNYNNEEPNGHLYGSIERYVEDEPIAFKVLDYASISDKKILHIRINLLYLHKIFRQ